MTYEFYLIWDDGYEDSYEVYSADERNENIQDIIKRRTNYKSAEYSRVYVSGKRGQRKRIL